MMRSLRTIVDPAALAEVVAEEYKLPVDRLVLLRSLVNDVYRVEAGDRAYVVKLYRAGHRTVPEVAWEVETSWALGGVLARGVPLADGSPAGSVRAAEGERPYSLWEWLPGERPGEPYDDELFRRYGAATAGLHAAADAAGVPERRFDMWDALGEPYAELLPRLAPADRDRTAGLIDTARAELSTMDLDTGFCHGDVSLDNLHVGGGRLVFYDLDRSGTGPRAADLTGVAATAHFPAFLDGYRSVRPMPEADLAAVPWLQAIDLVGNLHFHLIAKPLLRGTESLGEGWYESTLDALRSAATSVNRRSQAGES